MAVTRADMDGDGAYDDAVSLTFRSDGSVRRMLRVYSGATGKELARHDATLPFSPDVNLDGVVDARDVDMLVRTITLGDSGFDLPDVNLDGVVNVDDLEIVLRDFGQPQEAQQPVIVGPCNLFISPPLEELICPEGTVAAWGSFEEGPCVCIDLEPERGENEPDGLGAVGGSSPPPPPDDDDDEPGPCFASIEGFTALPQNFSNAGFVVTVNGDAPDSVTWSVSEGAGLVTVQQDTGVIFLLTTLGAPGFVTLEALVTREEESCTATFRFAVVGVEIAGPLDAGGQLELVRAAPTQLTAIIQPAGWQPDHIEWSFTGGAGGTRDTGTTSGTTITMVDDVNPYTARIRVFSRQVVHVAEDTKGIVVKPRNGPAWQITPTLMPDNEPTWGDVGAVNLDGGLLGETRDAQSDLPAIIVPSPFQENGSGWDDGYAMAQVTDPDGPNDGYWHITDVTPMKISMETVINKFIKPGGPLPDPVAAHNFFDQQNTIGAPCLSGAAVVTCIENHENGVGAGPGVGHFELIVNAEAMPGNDARQAVEDNFHPESESMLKIMADGEIQAIDSALFGAARTASGNCTLVISPWNQILNLWSSCTIIPNNEPNGDGTF